MSATLIGETSQVSWTTRSSGAFGVVFLLFICFVPNLGELDVVGMTAEEALAASPALGEQFHPQLLPQAWLVFYAMLVAAFVFALVFAPQTLSLNGSTILPYTLFLVLCGFSLVGTPAFSQAFDGLELRIMRRGFLEVLLAPTLALLAMSAFQSEKELKRIFRVFVIAGIFYSISLLFFGYEVGVEGMESRRQGIFAGVHAAAAHFLLCALFAFALSRFDKRSWRWPLLLLTAWFAVTQLLTNSKTAILAGLAMIAVSLLEGHGVRRFLAFVLILVLLFPVALQLIPANKASSITMLGESLLYLLDSSALDYSTSNYTPGSATSSFEARLWSLQLLRVILAESPWTGVGLGKHTAWVKDAFRGDPDVPVWEIHVYYATVAAETGTLGFLAFMALIVTALVISFRAVSHYRSEDNQPMYWMSKALMLSFMVVLILFLSGTAWYSHIRYFWVLIGLLGALDNLRRREARCQSSTGSRSATTIV